MSHTHYAVRTALVMSLVIALFGVSVLTSSTPAEARSNRVAVDATCMQTAVDARETTLMSAFETFNTDISTALTSRKDALHTAWGMTAGETRNAALKDSWKSWKSAHKEAFKDLKIARQSAWDTFKSTVKTTCKETLPKDESLTTDGAGSVAL